MEITYERGINGTGMILAAQPETNDGYAVRMMLENPIRGFLKMELRQGEEKSGYEYQVSALMSLSEYLEHHPLEQRLLKQWIFDLWQAVTELEEYLLTEEYVLLMPELVFLRGAENEPFAGTFLFCLYPDRRQDMKEQLKEMLKYLMKKTDSGDGEAASLCYELYSLVQKDNFCLKEFMEVLERQTQSESQRLPEKKKHQKQLFASRRNSGIMKASSR